MLAHFIVNVTVLSVTGFVSKVRVPSLPCAIKDVPAKIWHGTSVRMPTDDHETVTISPLNTERGCAIIVATAGGGVTGG